MDRDEIVRTWQQAENRLYPVATVRPDLYETCVGIVRKLADHLSSVPDVDALVTTYTNSDRDAELTAAGVDLAALPPEVELGMVRDAGYQVRSRELSGRESTEATLASIQRAKNAGERVAVIWRRGENELWPPYRRVDMDLGTGHAVAVITEMDPDTMTPSYSVEGLALDPESGEPVEEAPLSPRREFKDPEEWAAAAEDLRQVLLNH